jgi:hypothetical protein
MTQLRFIPPVLVGSAVLLVSSLSSAGAPAPPGCGSNPYCAAGFECVEVAKLVCVCGASGPMCPEPDHCSMRTEYGCAPAHCIADAQCGPGTVCHTWTEPCSVTDPTCMPQSVSLCTPRYLLPCVVAGDCGDGFACEAQVTDCSGAGSNGLPAAAGGAPGDATPIPECGASRCVAKDLACDSVAQCPAGWLCRLDTPSAPSTVCRPPYYGATSGNRLREPTATTPYWNPPSRESGTCQMGHAPASNAAFSLLTLLGALFGLKRRRAPRS